MGDSATTLRFEILGPVRAYRGADEVDLGPVRQRAVLALLLLRAGRPAPVAEIVAALWNGDPPENAVDAVQRYVGALRRALGPSLIAMVGDGYAIRVGPEAVDVGRFRAEMDRTGDPDGVRRALALWHDEPLTGLTGQVFESARELLRIEHATASRRLAGPQSAGPVPAGPVPADPVPVDPARADPVPADPARADPAYPDAVDPWDGHDLFPPHSII